MTYNAFIKFDGIEGESTDRQHQGWIEILNYDLDVSQTVSRTAISTGGATAERADFSVFGFTKLTDIATPRLTLACAAGTPIDTITVDLCRAGGDQDRFMRYTFTNCRISSVTTSTDGEYPEDDVNFFFGAIEWRFTQPYRSGGPPAGNMVAAWSLEKNCRV